MKKFLNLFAIALVALVAVSFISCGSDDDDSLNPDAKPKPTPTEFKFDAPCTNWGCSLDQMLIYMKDLPYVADEPYKPSDGKGMSYPYNSADDKTSYHYTFEDGKLVSCSVTYSEMNDSFEKFKEKVSSVYGVEEWKKQSYASDIVDWWTTTLKGKKTSISIGKSANYGGYMYVNISYTEFDW